MKRDAPLGSGSMFASAGCFSILIVLIAIFTVWNLREHRRILESGRKTTVTVLSKHKDPDGESPSVEVRLDERPSQEPFSRLLLGAEWDRVQPGDKLAYVYEPDHPTGGVLGTPTTASPVPVFALAVGVFVVPFLAIGIVLMRRERRAAGA